MGAGATSTVGPLRRSGRHDDVLLIPQPSDDPLDPLRWPGWLKDLRFFAVCFMAFSSLAANQCNQLAYAAQAQTFERELIEISYGGAAGVAGLLVGPIFLGPLSEAVGRTSVLFWCALGQIACQIWALEMRAPSRYVSFIISRLFCGLFGSAAPILGTGYVMDTYFLHQRGRRFAIYEVSFLLGTLAPGTISGLIVESLDWQWCFIWTIPVLGFAAILVLLLLEETRPSTYARRYLVPQASFSKWLSYRYGLIFFGWAMIDRPKLAELSRRFLFPFAIMLRPALLAPGFFTLLAFGFAIMVALLTSVYLQTPVSRGGYGFTPERNAYFSFVGWLASILAGVVAYFIGDRLPLAYARRANGGIWKPEYRLLNMLIPVILAPIGLGIFGATLQYHEHYLLLALGSLLINFSAQFCVPVCVNYASECYVKRSMEVAIAFNIWRLALGLALPFFATPWSKAVGFGWQFGMAAFFVLLAGIVLLCCAALSEGLRQRALPSYWAMDSEAGTRVIMDAKAASE